MSAASLLSWLNFFVADVRDGLGPFLGVFLVQNGFGEADIGLISSIASIAALILGVPCGILVDKTQHKKSLIALFIALIVISCSLNFFFPSFIFTLAAQLATALSGVFLAPAFAAITLGIMGNERYAAQCARNEAFKHAGTVLGAALCFALALYFGIASIFVITAILGGISLVILALIRADSIDNRVACGALDSAKMPKISAILFDKNVLFLSAVMFCFHLSNAAMLPLLSQRAYKMGVDATGAYAAATIIIAQSAMILVAFICGKLVGERRENLGKNLGENRDGNLCKNRGENRDGNRGENLNLRVYFWLFFACFFALIIRALIAANFADLGAMVCVQILDGVGAGVSGVIVPIIVAFMLRGSGHINAGLSVVLTFGGLGAALSGGFGGYFAQHYGYFAAYVFLGAVACAGLALWVAKGRTLFIKQNAL